MKIVRPLSCVLLLSLLSLAACSSHPERNEKPKKTEPGTEPQTQLSETELRHEADVLYRHARAQLDAHDYTTASTEYDKLIARYPFTDYGTQAELEKAYAQYKNYEYDDAASSVDHFLRDHPRHQRADYAQYLKGLIEFDRRDSLLDSVGLDTSKQDVTSDKLAFSAFSLLILKYPNSQYVADARLRMIYLRDRVAQHDLSIVGYYMRRGAWIAAAKRCEEIISTYPGSPASGQALKILVDAYHKAGLEPEAQAAEKLLAGNPGVLHPVKGIPPKRTLLNEPAAQQSSALPADAVTVADNTAPAPPAAPVEKKGLFSRFAGWFDIFDTTKPENTYTIVIPTSHDAASATPAAAGTAGSPAVAAPAAGSASAATATTTPSATPTAAPASHSLHVTVGPDDSEAWHPADAAGPGGSSQPAPATDNKDSSGAQAPAPGK